MTMVNPSRFRNERPNVRKRPRNARRLVRGVEAEGDRASFELVPSEEEDN
jgi:hypothetical protein